MIVAGQNAVGRFAPSPTGRMHLGNLLCALLSYLDVKSLGGKWILRIEDIDRSRSRDEYAVQIEKDLRTFGLNWDEGGIEDPLFVQSRRSEFYDREFRKIEDSTYPCFCTRADLMAASAPHESDGRMVYGGKCRPRRFGGQGEAGLADRPAATRIFVPDMEVECDDAVYGRQSFNLARDFGDFVIRRADGGWSYQFAVVVDDALMGVNRVVRGRDLLSSVAPQSFLFGRIGCPVPQYAHIPLVCAPDGRRLGKRDADFDLGAVLSRMTPEQVIGRLAFLCGLVDRPEPLKADDLIPGFDWGKIDGTKDIIIAVGCNYRQEPFQNRF